MLKLIASDLDGTLLQNGSQRLTKRAVELFGLLMDKGILFTAASGRQYPNLRRLFGSLEERMAFICENGAYVVYREEELFSSALERKLGLEMMREIARTEECEILLSGKNTSYIQPKTEEYVHRMKYIVRNNVTIVEDIFKVEEPFLKISVYRKRGIGAVEEHFHKVFGDRAKATVSGFSWLDFTESSVNKGAALRVIQERLGILPEETIVFGDNYNDIEMFECAAESFVMAHSVPKVKEYANRETSCVEDILEQLIKEHQ